MKQLIPLILFIFSTYLISAQNNITNIKPITQQEFLQLKNVNEGDIVLIIGEGTIYYYSGNKWFAMKGECYPKPVSPKIDSIIFKNKKINVYFDDTNKNFQKYILITDALTNNVDISESPALISPPTNNGTYDFTIIGKNECTTSGPISNFRFEFKEQ